MVFSFQRNTCHCLPRYQPGGGARQGRARNSNPLSLLELKGHPPCSSKWLSLTTSDPGNWSQLSGMHGKLQQPQIGHCPLVSDRNAKLEESQSVRRARSAVHRTAKSQAILPCISPVVQTTLNSSSRKSGYLPSPPLRFLALYRQGRP